MDQEKFLAIKIETPISYKEAFDRVMGWSDAECRLILFGLLMGFEMKSTLADIQARRKLHGII